MEPVEFSGFKGPYSARIKPLPGRKVYKTEVTLNTFAESEVIRGVALQPSGIAMQCVGTVSKYI
jgi:hypothetical protein